MTALPLLGWLVAGGLLLVVAWLKATLVLTRRAAEKLVIAAQESDAWADEYQREAAVLAADNARLNERLASMTELYGEAVRRLLAVNYVVIHTNLKWKRRRQDQ